MHKYKSGFTQVQSSQVMDRCVCPRDSFKLCVVINYHEYFTVSKSDSRIGLSDPRLMCRLGSSHCVVISHQVGFSGVFPELATTDERCVSCKLVVSVYFLLNHSRANTFIQVCSCGVFPELVNTGGRCVSCQLVIPVDSVTSEPSDPVTHGHAVDK